ncbi:MAG: lactonase family protein [Limnohabitans sp.]
MPFVYVSHAVSGEIQRFALPNTGSPTAPSACVLGSGLGPMCIDPIARHVYVAKRGEVNTLVCLSADHFNGELAIAHEVPLTARMCYLSLDRERRFLLAVSYHSHSLTVCPLNSTKLPSLDHTVVSTLRHPHAVVFSPDNRFVWVSCLGDDTVMVFAFDENTGQLQLKTPWLSRAGSGPRHMCLHPDGKIVYVLNELDATVDVLAWDAKLCVFEHLQHVSSLPLGFSGKPWAADLHLSPDAGFLYTSERTSSTLAVFKVDSTSGKLHVLAHTPTETQPRSFAVSADGSQLWVAGQISNHLAVYARDMQSGLLTIEQRIEIGLEPGWVACLA